MRAAREGLDDGLYGVSVVSSVGVVIVAVLGDVDELVVGGMVGGL